MTTYYCRLDVNSEDTAPQAAIQAGNLLLNFDFQWAVASEEQASFVYKYLQNKAKGDPLVLSDGNYNRDYDWYSYYISLENVDLTQWLATNPILPVSLHNKEQEQLLYLLSLRIQEAVALKPVITLYSETVCWQFQCQVQGQDVITGLVKPGGWFRNQDNVFSFRFLSNLDTIGKTNLNNVYLEIEVYDE